MDVSLASFITLYVFTTGRRLFTFGQVKTLAKRRGFSKLEKHCAAAIAHDGKTRELERRWQAQPDAKAGNAEAQRVDVQVDRTLGALADGAKAQARGAAPDDPVVAKVDAFLAEVFPNGVPAVTNLAFVDELAAVDDIVKLLETTLAPSVKELGLGRIAKRLAGLAGDYRTALEAAPPSLIDYGKVRAASATGQNLLLATVAIILGEHHGDGADDVAARTALMAPIVKQNEAIGLYLRSRKAVEDVDPETGEPVPAPVGGAATEPEKK